MYTIITFSPTGNSRYVANKIRTALNCKNNVLELEKITNMKDSNMSNQHLILVSTIRAFDFPQVVHEFIKSIPTNHYKYVSIVGVGCNNEWINSACSMRAKELFISKNIEVIVDTVVAMPLNLIKAFPYQTTQNLLQQIEIDVKAIATNIQNGTKTESTMPFKARCISKINIIERNAVKLFGLELYADKNCVKCGKCVADCPTKNIKFNEKKQVKFGFKCMLCLRCVYECPKNAISPLFSKFVLIKGGYKPPIDKN